MALVVAGVGAIGLEYRVPVKVSRDCAILLDSLGCNAFRKAGIQAFYSGASQNCTGVILDIWGIAAGLFDSSHAGPRGDSATAFENTPLFSDILVHRGTGNPALSALPGALPYRSAGGKPSRSTKRSKNAEKSPAEYPFPVPHGLKLGL